MFSAEDIVVNKIIKLMESTSCYTEPDKLISERSVMRTLKHWRWMSLKSIEMVRKSWWNSFELSPRWWFGASLMEISRKGIWNRGNKTLNIPVLSFIIQEFLNSIWGELLSLTQGALSDTGQAPLSGKSLFPDSPSYTHQANIPFSGQTRFHSPQEAFLPKLHTGPPVCSLSSLSFLPIFCSDV